MADDYQKSELTTEEDSLFDSEWDSFLTRHFREREVIDVYQDHYDAIKETCRVAKYQLESIFGGVNARSNEFGWMPIMPQHLLATTIPTYATKTWEQTITTTDVVTGSQATPVPGWKDWIGTSASQLKVSKYGTLIIVGFHDPVDVPKIDGILANIKSVGYPIWYFGSKMQYTNYPIMELTTPIVVEKEQEFHLQEFCGRAGISKLRQLGVYFATGDHMRDRNAYAQI